jgi:tetratricopeptide (TPR) repeat protein
MTSKKLHRIVIVLITILISNVTYGHTSYPDTVKCPIDGQEFVIYVTMSYTTFNTLKDFQKQGAIGDLYESYVNSCPKCHYSGYQKDIDTTFDEKTKQDILKILEPFKNDTMNDVLENEIAVKIHLYFNRDNSEISNLYLVASYFLKGDTLQVSKRKELQQNCINYLMLAIKKNEYPNKETYATINYLIGELYRRVGDFDNAIKFYELALNDRNKLKWLKEIVIDQKKLAEKKDDDNSI